MYTFLEQNIARHWLPIFCHSCASIAYYTWEGAYSIDAEMQFLSYEDDFSVNIVLASYLNTLDDNAIRREFGLFIWSKHPSHGDSILFKLLTDNV